jgi:hypothetical protein
VHLEAAATVGIIPHLVRIANEGLQAMMAAAQAHAAALQAAAASGPGPSSGQQHQPQVLPLSVGEAAEAAASSDEASLLDPLAR